MSSDFDLLLSNEYYISKSDAIELIEEIDRKELKLYDDYNDYYENWQKAAIVDGEHYTPYEFADMLRNDEFSIHDIKVQSIVNWFIYSECADMRGTIKEFGEISTTRIRLARGKYVTNDTERFYVYERNSYLGRLAVKSTYDFENDLCHYWYEYYSASGEYVPSELLFCFRISVDLRLIREVDSQIGYDLGRSAIAYCYDHLDAEGWPEIW